MTYKLKPNQESFDVVDGPYAGKRYKAGQVYDDIPPQEKHRFERIAQSAKPERIAQSAERKERKAESREQKTGPVGPVTMPAKEQSAEHKK